MLLFVAASAILARQASNLIPGDLPEAKIQAPVSFRQAYLSFSDFCTSLSKQSGIKLTVRKDLADRKVVIECKDRPAGEVLSKFAETFGGRWTEQAGVLKFDLNPTMRDEERLAAKAEEDRTRERLSWLLHMAVLLSGDSRETRARKAAEAGREMNQLSHLGTNGSDPHQALAWAEVEAYNDSFLPRLGIVIKGHESEILDTLLEERHVFGSTLPAPETLPLTASFFSDPSESAMIASGKWIGLFALRYESQRNVLYDNESILDGQPVVNGSASSVLYWDPPANGSLKILKLLSNWASVQDKKLLDIPVKPNDVKPESPYDHGRLSWADELIDLSDRSDVPIIGDGLRREAFEPSWLSGDIVSGWLAQFNANRYDRRETAFFRTSDGWLMYRNAQYWKYLDAEIPEKTLRPMEQKQLSDGLTLDDYCRFATSLTRKQANWLDTALVCFSKSPLRNSYDALLFLAGLSSSRKAEMEHGPVNVLSLSPSERVPLREALFSFGTNQPTMQVEVLTGRSIGSRFTVHLENLKGERTPWRDDLGFNPGKNGTLLQFDGGSSGGLSILFVLPTQPGSK